MPGPWLWEFNWVILPIIATIYGLYGVWKERDKGDK